MNFLRFLKKPVVIESARVAAIMGTGDIIAQTLVERKAISDLDLIRTAKFSGVGLFFVGPVLKVWYSKLEQFVSPHQKPLLRGFKKMCIDQLFFAPVFTAAIIGVLGKVNQESNSQIKQRLQSDYGEIMLRNYTLWPAAQMINFGFVPLAYQVIFAQFVAIIWNTYISMILNKY